MKHIGIALIVAGVISVFASLIFDTTFASSYGSRSHNIGLMQEQQNYLLLSSLSIIVGTLLFGFSTIKQNEQTGKFGIVLASLIYLLSFIIGGNAIYTLTPSYKEKKEQQEKLNSELEKLNSELQESLERMRRLMP